MLKSPLLVCIFSICSIGELFAQQVLQNDKDIVFAKDWLVDSVGTKAQVYKTGNNIILNNGLVKRAFRIYPNVVCIDYKNLSDGQQLLRAIKPEARVVIDNKEYNVGGLHGQTENAYLVPEWINNFTTDQKDFQFLKFEISDLKPFVSWKPKGWLMNKNQPTGKMLTFIFQSKLLQLRNI